MIEGLGEDAGHISMYPNAIKETINNPGGKWKIEAEGETRVASYEVTPSFISNHQIKTVKLQLSHYQTGKQIKA